MTNRKRCFLQGDDLTSLHNGKRSWPEERLANKMMRERERGGGRWSVKYEEVITLVAAGRTYLEERRLGTMVPRRGLCGLEQRKGGVVTVVAVVREGRKSSSTGWCK